MLLDFFNGAHFHLLVNHVSILGAFLAVALLVGARLAGGDVVRRTALVLLVGTAIAAAAANYSGEGAEDAIEGLPGVTRDLIHEHEEAAEGAFLAAVVLGAAALGVLLRWRRDPLPRAARAAMLVGAGVVSGWMGYAGMLGGRVRHTEVRSATSATRVAGQADDRNDRVEDTDDR